MVLTLIIGIIKTFLGYASKRNDNATATALEGLRADVELSREQAEITRAKIGLRHRVQRGGLYLRPDHGRGF
jgi:hypothetical protein